MFLSDKTVGIGRYLRARCCSVLCLTLLACYFIDRTSRLYWSIKDPTKRCRYYCTVKEKKSVKVNVKKAHQDYKDLNDQEHAHKVISHEELNRKEKSTKSLTSSRGDVNRTPYFHPSCKTHDYLNTSYGKKLKKIAPHPGPSFMNHSPFPGVIYTDNSGAIGSSSHFPKLRKILPAPHKSLLHLPSPTNSPKKMLQHITQQASQIPALFNSAFPDPMPISVSNPVQNPAVSPSSSSPTSATSPTPLRNRKTPPGVKRTMSFEETIPQTVRQLNCDHEVVTKAAGAELSNSPVKEKPKSWLSKERERDGVAKGEELDVTFVITSEEGLRIEADTCDGT